MGIEDDIEHIKSMARHIQMVRGAGAILFSNLKDDILRVAIYRRTLQHDDSKLFFQDEWKHLRYKKKSFKNFTKAQNNHWRRNEHHPEHWNGDLMDMPDDAIGEMVCDWYARSCEQGNDIKAWLLVAKQKYEFTKHQWKLIEHFVNILLEPKMV
jgi:hypothetical protein